MARILERIRFTHAEACERGQRQRIPLATALLYKVAQYAMSLFCSSVKLWDYLRFEIKRAPGQFPLRFSCE
jgi:hypothetical protein